MRPRFRSALLALAATVPLLAGCGALDDALSPGRRDAAPARVALAARLPLLSKAGAAATVQLRVTASYQRDDGSRVPLGTQTATLSEEATQQVPVAIDLAPCLADPRRATDAGGGCVVTLAVALLEGNRVVDEQTVGPLRLQVGATATVAEPVQLFEVESVRVGTSLTGSTTGDGVRVVVGESVALDAAVQSTTGQVVAGRTVQWSSDAPTVARVDAATGVVTGVSVGRTRVTAAAAGTTGGVDVNVVPRPSPIGVTGTGFGSGGSGTVRSSPDGIDCRISAGQAQGACTFTFPGDAQVTLTAIPDLGATFAGWGGACALAAGASCTVDAAQARTLTASFGTARRLGVSVSGPGTVTGTSIACGGGGSACSALFDDGASVTLTATPAAGQAFAGWSGACANLTTPQCTVTLLGGDASVGVRFSAPLALTVAGSGDGGGAIGGAGIACTVGAGRASGSCSAELPFGTVVTLTATPNASSAFAGWSGACAGTGACEVRIDQAREVEARFTRRQVSIALTLDGGGSGALNVSGAGGCSLTAGAGSASCTVPVPIGDVVTITASAGTGADFTGWSGACAGRSTVTCTLTANADVAVGARFATTLLALDVAPAHGSTGSGRVRASAGAIDCSFAGATTAGTCESSAIPFGTVVTLTAAPAQTATFGGWGGACSQATGPTCTVTVAAAASVTARFDEIRYPLAVTLSGSGGVQSSPSGVNCPANACTTTFTALTQVTLTAVPEAGTTFAGWTGACAGSGPTCVVSMDAARGVTATFVQVTVPLSVTKGGAGSGTVTSAPAGIDCPGAGCSASYPIGTTVTLTATPTGGSTFAGWSGACAGTSATCVVAMSAARSAMATFAPPVFPVSVARAGAGTGSVVSTPAGIDCPGVACAASYAAGATVTLTATPTGGSTFTGWTGACAGSGPTCVVSVDAARSVTATFAPHGASTPQAAPLTVSVTGAGVGTVTGGTIDCPGACSQSLPIGATVTLVATPATGGGSEFGRWGGACGGTSPTCVVTMNSAKSVTASFIRPVLPPAPPVPNPQPAPARYTLTVGFPATASAVGTVRSSPAGIVCGSVCSATFDAETVVTLTAHPTTGKFVGWAGACSGTGHCVVTMNQARQVTAIFRR